MSPRGAEAYKYGTEDEAMADLGSWQANNRNKRRENLAKKGGKGKSKRRREEDWEEKIAQRKKIKAGEKNLSENVAIAVEPEIEKMAVDTEVSAAESVSTESESFAPQAEIAEAPTETEKRLIEVLKGTSQTVAAGQDIYVRVAKDTEFLVQAGGRLTVEVAKGGSIKIEKGGQYTVLTSKDVQIQDENSADSAATEVFQSTEAPAKKEASQPVANELNNLSPEDIAIKLITQDSAEDFAKYLAQLETQGNKVNLGRVIKSRQAQTLLDKRALALTGNPEEFKVFIDSWMAVGLAPGPKVEKLYKKIASKAKEAEEKINPKSEPENFLPAATQKNYGRKQLGYESADTKPKTADTTVEATEPGWVQKIKAFTLPDDTENAQAEAPAPSRRFVVDSKGGAQEMRKGFAVDSQGSAQITELPMRPAELPDTKPTEINEPAAETLKKKRKTAKKQTNSKKTPETQKSAVEKSPRKGKTLDEKTWQGIESAVKNLEKFNFGQAKNFDQLYAEIEKIKAVQGSEQLYSADELKDIINQVRKNQLDLKYVTRTGGLREKVSQLWETEKDQKRKTLENLSRDNVDKAVVSKKPIEVKIFNQKTGAMENGWTVVHMNNETGWLTLLPPNGKKNKSEHAFIPLEQVQVWNSERNLDELFEVVNSARTFEDLKDEIEIYANEHGNIHGSTHDFDPPTLLKIINRVRAGDAGTNINQVTRSGGLRQKVSELITAEAKKSKKASWLSRLLRRNK